MAQQILQINFQFSSRVHEFEKAVSFMAEDYIDLPGLQWKVWIMNSAEKEAGGIYLFENAAAVTQYVESPLFKAFQTNPVLSKLEVKQFDVLGLPGLLTNAPLKKSTLLHPHSL